MSPSPESVKDFQKRIVDSLNRVIQENVIPEWPADRDNQDALNRKIYSPHPDVAVGPFNTGSRTAREQARLIERRFQEHIHFFEKLRESAAYSNNELGSNANPRCLVAVEIENTRTTKHRLGSLLNAAVLGKVGIVIGWDAKALRSLKRICGYLNFLYWHGKLGTRVPEAIVMDPSSFEKVLAEF